MSGPTSTHTEETKVPTSDSDTSETEQTDSGSGAEGGDAGLLDRLRRNSRGVVVAAMVIVLLLVAGGIALDRGLMPWQDDDHTADRAAALAAARDAASTLTTLDAADPEASIAAWSEVATGELREAVESGQADFQQLITTGGFDTASSIQEAAVATFEPGEGDAAASAEVLVAIDVTLTPTNGQANLERLSLAVTVDETDDGWKASALTPVSNGTTVGGEADEIATDISAAMVRLWSYDYRDLGGVDSLVSITTPDFLDEYAATYQRIEKLAPDAKAVVKAQVTGIATIVAEDDRATVLVFLTQRARKGGDGPTAGATRLRVAVEKVDGSWVVDGVTPI